MPYTERTPAAKKSDLSGDASVEELIKALGKRVERLEEELMWLRAERVEARLDSGEGMTFPAELVRRIFVCDEPSIRVFREWRGLTQQQLAERIGVSKSYISQLETRHRKPGVATLKKLAAALDVPFHVLAE